MTDIFKQIVSGSQVEGAVITTLNKWFSTYMQEVEIQLGMARGKTPVPKKYTTRNRMTEDMMVEDQLPKVVVVSPGLIKQPVAEGDGTYRASWAVGVGVIASAKDHESSDALAKAYGATVRALLTQKSGLEGFAQKLEWTGERYDDVPLLDRTRTVMTAQETFNVEVEGVVNRFAGPAYPTMPDPTNQPGSQWPTAQHVIITLKLL